MIGAVNSVTNDNGKLKGYNTDTIGFIESLTRDGKFDAKGKKIVLLGAGGAAKAISVALCKEEIMELSILDTDKIKAAALVNGLTSHFQNRIIEIANSDSLKQFIVNADCIINATPLGMYPKINASPLDESAPIHEGHLFFDVIYNPVETLFIKTARAKGAKVLNGFGMFVRQGTAAFELFTGKAAPVKVMWNAAEEALGIEKTLLI